MKIENDKSALSFRCKHRHSAASHPQCYLKYLNGDTGVVERKMPKILLFDIETSPLKAFIFQKSVWKANISADQVISEWFMLCWSAKWLFEDNIMSDRLSGEEAINEDDKRIVEKLWKLLDEADIVIAHNGDSFDLPNMNTRFVVHGLPPTSPYQTIDTKLVAKRQFGFTHNSLNGLAKVFGFDVKLETDFELWKSCVSGDEESLKYMEVYNRGDVVLLEEIYLKLRPWIRPHPNVGLFIESETPVCPNCGNSELTLVEDKFHRTQVSKFPVFKCRCGAYGRVRKSVVAKEVSKNLLVGLSK